MDSMSDLLLPDDYSHQPYLHNHPFQMIFDSLNLCQDFQNLEVITPHIATTICHLQRVTLSDLSIDPSVVRSLTRAKCMSIFESQTFDIAAFLLPKGYVLHLHDHPHMMVCTKLLAGSVSIRSFSKSQDVCYSSDEFLAKLEVQQIKTEEDQPWYLTPQHGNYHEITALSNCVMLDLLLPPYHDDNRPCTFYSAFEQLRADGGIDWILRPLPLIIEQTLEMPIGMTYTGYVPRQIFSPTTSNESNLSHNVENSQLERREDPSPTTSHESHKSDSDILPESFELPISPRKSTKVI